MSLAPPSTSTREGGAETAAPTPGAGVAGGRWTRLRAWSRRRLLESWGGSLAVHGVLVLLLGTITLSLPQRAATERVIEMIERPEELLNERLDEDQTPAARIALTPSDSGTPGMLPAGAALAADKAPVLDRRVVESLDGPQVRLADVSLRAMHNNTLSDDLGMESPGDPSAAVENYAAAMHRITQELLLMLAKGPALVMWLFDQSESMQNDQEEIQRNLSEIYAELKLTSADDGDALLTSVSSYGSEMVTHTRRPTSDLTTVRAAIDEIPVDASGVEAMCQAVISTIAQHQRFGVQGKRQLALILVTDESGDDPEGIEAAVAAAREANCRVYILGREAVFGYPFVHIVWHDEATGYDYWIPIKRGPETPDLEQLQTDGLWRRRDAFPSGFGPYEQVRLCRRTGGVFYLLPSLETNVLEGEQRRYAIEAMRPYLPDLDSREEYRAALVRDPLRLALRETIEALDPWKHEEVNLAEYFPLDPAEFRKLAEAQVVRVGGYLEFLQVAETRLKGLRAARNQESSPRWQANYDLMLAQVVGYQVRANEYWAALEQFVSDPARPQDPKTNHWRVTTVPRLLRGEAEQALIERANGLFQAVIEFHPGTPYAARAHWELERGYGVAFVEHYHPPDYDQVKRPAL